MNHRDILAYARGVPNVFEKEIPRLVRMSGASAILSCERRIQYTSCYLCLIFPLVYNFYNCCIESWPRLGTLACEESCIQSTWKNDSMAMTQVADAPLA